MRVKTENSEFKILNFTSYKKFYFHWLVSVELKPHTKVLKNLFHNRALKNLYVTIVLPSYFSIGHKMAPNKCCGIFFFALVWPCTLEHHRHQRKCRCFLLMFTFSDFNRKYPFWVNLVQKNQNYQFILKFGTCTNSNM